MAEKIRDRGSSSGHVPLGGCIACGAGRDSPLGAIHPSCRPRPPPQIGSINPAAILPIPQPRPIFPIQLPHEFVEPKKRISSSSDIDKFHQSEAGKNFLGFVVCLGEAIKGHKLSDEAYTSEVVKGLVQVLEVMSKWVDDVPPKEHSARYGNPAYRDWHGLLTEKGPELIQSLLSEELKGATLEIFPYFADSFGNATRIDYGTGHETHFAAFLLCLTRLGMLREEDYHALVSRVFVKYLDLMRKLQLTYWLEPAGSHGVWGLDDYHFLPFIFGASQLVDHKYMKPKSIHNQDILDSFSKEYMYLGCVSFAKKVKKGYLAEHSPMLNDISGVALWSKVYTGMLKMYRAEVLEKVPIMQHFLFGSIISWSSLSPSLALLSSSSSPSSSSLSTSYSFSISSSSTMSSSSSADEALLSLSNQWDATASAEF